MVDNKLYQSEKGFGCFLDDVGILMENCVFKQNKDGGLFVTCHEKPSNPL
jgi:hypothetical protein